MASSKIYAFLRGVLLLAIKSCESTKFIVFAKTYDKNSDL